MITLGSATWGMPSAIAKTSGALILGSAIWATPIASAKTNTGNFSTEIVDYPKPFDSGSHAAVIRAHNSDLFMAIEVTENYDTTAGLIIIQSTDGGQTWGAFAEIDTDATPAQEVLPVFLKGANNNIYFIYTELEAGNNPGYIWFYKINFDNPGWSIGSPVVVTDDGGSFDFISIEEDSNGVLFVAFNYNTLDPSRHIRVFYSEDEGATWASTAQEFPYSFKGKLKKVDGNKIALFVPQFSGNGETGNIVNFIVQTRSDSDGLTAAWSTPQIIDSWLAVSGVNAPFDVITTSENICIIMYIKDNYPGVVYFRTLSQNIISAPETFQAKTDFSSKIAVTNGDRLFYLCDKEYNSLSMVEKAGDMSLPLFDISPDSQYQFYWLAVSPNNLDDVCAVWDHTSFGLITSTYYFGKFTF